MANSKSPLAGVNLGGWLVLEKWLTPSVFAGTHTGDEYTLMREPGGKARIQKHRKTFITEKDFAWLAAHGITIVRIPVGYWLFEPLDGFLPAAAHLDNALRWAHKHGIQVLIDLHAARGSQNGFDSSGRIGAANWFTHKTYQQQTITVLEHIAHRYKNNPALWGIELLNEPLAGRHYRTLRRFYRHSYKSLRSILPPHISIVFHDAFRPWLYASVFWRQRRGAAHPLIMDVHWYVSPVRARRVGPYLKRSHHMRRVVLRLLQLWHPILIGEWSSVLPQPFFDATPQPTHNALLAQNIAMQQRAHTGAVGAIYWNYKAEGGGMWSYRSLVEQEVINTSAIDK